MALYGAFSVRRCGGCRNDRGVEPRKGRGKRSLGCCSIPHVLDQDGWGKTLTRLLCLFQRRLCPSSPATCAFQKQAAWWRQRQGRFCLVPYRHGQTEDWSWSSFAMGVTGFVCFLDLCAGVCFRLGQCSRSRNSGGLQGVREASTAREWCRDLSPPASAEYERAWASILSHAR